MTRIVSFIVGCAVITYTNAFYTGSGTYTTCTKEPKLTSLAATRRSLLQNASKTFVVGTSSMLLGRPIANAREVTDVTSGGLPDLPPDAQRSYLQYRFPLQLAADFYIFDLQTMVGDTG